MVHKHSIIALIVAACCAAAPSVAVAQQKGKRASITDVSKNVRGEDTTPNGPNGFPQPPKAEDGRDYVYLGVVHVTAIRNRRAARSYGVWPRFTLPEGSSPDDLLAVEVIIQDTLVSSLTEIAQIDWPGAAKLDTAIAAQLAKQRVDAILGKDKIDALDFVHVEVQVF
ncbi:MAG: hypothetical protein ACKVH0_18910 [Alphaproteobacteria bacterium]|jgi:hypothetical protein